MIPELLIKPRPSIKKPWCQHEKQRDFRRLLARSIQLPGQAAGMTMDELDQFLENPLAPARKPFTNESPNATENPSAMATRNPSKSGIDSGASNSLGIYF